MSSWRRRPCITTLAADAHTQQPSTRLPEKNMPTNSPFAAKMLHIVVLLLAIPLRARAGSLHKRGATFDWSTVSRLLVLACCESHMNLAQVNASTELSWTPCYDTFQCSKLTVQPPFIRFRRFPLSLIFVLTRYRCNTPTAAQARRR